MINVLCTLFLLLFCAGTASASPAVNDCKSTPEFSDNVNLVIFDGTTAPRELDKKRFSEGLKRILFSKDTTGLIQAYIVGPKEFTSRIVHESCVPRYISGNKSDQANSQKTILDYLASIKAYLTPSAPTRDKSKHNADTASPIVVRDGIGQAIFNKALSEAKEERTTCILNDLVYMLEDRPQTYTHIQITCFTDLQDSALRSLVKSGGSLSAWESEAKKTASRYKLKPMLETNSKPTARIIFWGLGRSEDPRQGTVSMDTLEKLKLFWRTALTSILLQKFSKVDVQFYIDLPSQY